MTELEKIKAKIEAAEVKLTTAEEALASDARIISLQNTITELQKKENILLARAGD